MADSLEDNENQENELLRILRRHLTEDNPNPNKDGCPSGEALRALALDSIKGDTSLRRHLTICSRCYLAFEQLLKHGALDRKHADGQI